MQNIVIISEEEKEILLKNITTIKGISSQLRSYLEKNMGEEHKPMDFELCDYDEGFSRL